MSCLRLAKQALAPNLAPADREFDGGLPRERAELLAEVVRQMAESHP